VNTLKRFSDSIFKVMCSKREIELMSFEYRKISAVQNMKESLPEDLKCPVPLLDN
jgi:hypothetical protein